MVRVVHRFDILEQLGDGGFLVEAVVLARQHVCMLKAVHKVGADIYAPVPKEFRRPYPILVFLLDYEVVPAERAAAFKEFARALVDVEQGQRLVVDDDYIVDLGRDSRDGDAVALRFGLEKTYGVLVAVLDEPPLFKPVEYPLIIDLHDTALRDDKLYYYYTSPKTVLQAYRRT